MATLGPTWSASPSAYARGGPLPKRGLRSHERAPRFVTPASLIDQRPQIVEARVRVGDWEGDLIVGPDSRSAIATLVDRHSRYVKLVHLPGGHSAEELRAALTPTLLAVPEAACRTLTWDQGSEMVSHDQIASLFSDRVLFAHAGAHWQRGSSENTKGLLRQSDPQMDDSAQVFNTGLRF